MSTADELGNQAYKKALFQDYKGAVSILNSAISKFPRDPRFYNNLAYCHLRLHDHKQALIIAQFMVTNFPTYSKSYYRKAEALIELKKYKEAELALKEVIKLEPKCEDAKFLLSEVQITILCAGGKYWVLDALRALRFTNHDTAKAAQYLKVGGRKGTNYYSGSDLYESDEESITNNNPTTLTPCASTTDEIDPYTDPSNPFNCSSIWVGNITRRITPDKLKAIFGKYGKIKGEIIVHQNSCAFINYTDPKMAAAAMRNFPQHFSVEDTALVIRYPLNNPKPANPGVVAKKSSTKLR